MKIQKTDKGNVKIVLAKEQYNSLYMVLDNLSLDDYHKYTSSLQDVDNVTVIWGEMANIDV